ncbi:hypothetical protein E2320_014384 [Naja naja]|nr:hypothetical protein E2320_014384 [Naja naja]
MEPELFDPPSDTSSTPKNHQKSHECSECGKSFAHRSLLLTHRKVHVGSGPSDGLEALLANKGGFFVRGPSCGGLCRLPFSAQVREAESGSVPPFQPRAHPAQLEGRGSPGGSLQAVLNLRPFRSCNRACPQKVLYDFNL